MVILAYTIVQMNMKQLILMSNNKLLAYQTAAYFKFLFLVCSIS